METPAKPDYYQLLGVSRAANGQEIKSAFLKFAAQFHGAGKPRNIDDVEEIRRYATAYRVLADATKRKYYDQTGFHPVDKTVPLAAEPFPVRPDNFWTDFAAEYPVVIEIGLGFLDLS